jgi:hypothetical protein
MTRYTAARIDQIQRHLSDLAAQQVPVSEFARGIGVSAWTVYTWKRRFGECSDSRPAHPVARAKLIEIDPPRSSSTIELAIDRWTIRLSAGFESNDLVRVLQAVQSC